MPNPELQKFSFTVETKGLRFDQFLALQFPAISLTRLRAAIKQGAARVNTRTSFAGWVLLVGDQITVQIDPGEPTAAKPENIPLEILYEDNDVLVINKATGLLSHPSSTEKSGTVMNALAYYFLHSPQKPQHAVSRPILLHRLDRDTSGVLAIAKNERAGRIVSKAFRDRRVQKRYLALVNGVVESDSGKIDAPIGRNPHTWPRWCVREDGEISQTNYFVKQRFAKHSLLELEPLTGRTHQLRIHCAHIGHSIVGDQVYKVAGTEEIPNFKTKHQILHAHMLSFRLPTGGEETSFIAPMPKIMQEIIAHLSAQN